MRFSSLFQALVVGFFLLVNLSAQTIRITFTAGAASIQRPEEPALRPALKGETLVIGTRIVTGADGRLVITPFPGIKSIITPNSTVVIEDKQETATGSTVTQKTILDLKEGAVVSDLQKPEGVTYDYSIRTARGLAGARGTTYIVGMNSKGIQTIAVSHGTIEATLSNGVKAKITPGQLSITKSDGTTQQVSNVNELSADDQAIARKWTETTIQELTNAMQNGIPINPAALQNALDSAKALGITLPPQIISDAQQAIDTALPPEVTAFLNSIEELDPAAQEAAIKKFLAEHPELETAVTSATASSDTTLQNKNYIPPVPATKVIVSQDKVIETTTKTIPPLVSPITNTDQPR